MKEKYLSEVCVAFLLVVSFYFLLYGLSLVGLELDVAV